MTASLYQSSIALFIPMLGNMKAWLDKAAAQQDEAALLEARLAPDMYGLVGQIQIASDAAKGAAARLTGVEPPSMPDTETTFAELKARCDKTIAYLQSIDPAAYDAGAAREIEIRFPNGGGLKFDAVTYVNRFAVPNFLFHATTAYAILRNAGVVIGKLDYLAHLAPHMFAPPAPAEA